MKKYKEDQFFDKFRYLNSQESSQEIIWSCSDSSDNECKNHEKSTAVGTGTLRKRVNIRRKARKDTSNLEITFVDDSERNTSLNIYGSPVLMKPKSDQIQLSPILTTSRTSITKIVERKIANKPPITPFNIDHSCADDGSTKKSPIVNFTRKSPSFSPKVRKKLFKSEDNRPYENENCIERNNELIVNCGSTSPILSQKKNFNKRKYPNSDDFSLRQDKGKRVFRDVKSINIQPSLERYNNLKYQCLNSFVTKFESTKSLNKYSENEEIIIETSSSSSLDETVIKTSHTELIAKVKCYFDNNFKPESSQASISECETSTPKYSTESTCEIDISSPRSQERCTDSVSLNNPTTMSFESHINAVKTKKVKLKKGGLAYRLDAILKKQNTSVSLWQHERFLAANSNFVIPKQMFAAFRIKNIVFKYGIYLLETLNSDDELFFVVINNIYVKCNKSFEIDDILKIYEPFKIMDYFQGSKVIVNVCKFECEKLPV